MPYNAECFTQTLFYEWTTSLIIIYAKNSAKCLGQSRVLILQIDPTPNIGARPRSKRPNKGKQATNEILQERDTKVVGPYTPVGSERDIRGSA